MVFGTDRFFNHLKNGIISDGSETFYSEVLKTIERDAYPRIMSRLNYPDAEDVMQQVLLSVWTSLAKYVMTSENLMPQQRNAWLIRIIDNKIADYYRKRYATIEISCNDTERVFDELIKNDPQEAFVLEEDRRLHQRQVDNLMCFICSINMIPEKIIAFFYSKVQPQTFWQRPEVFWAITLVFSALVSVIALHFLGYSVFDGSGLGNDVMEGIADFLDVIAPYLLFAGGIAGTVFYNVKYAIKNKNCYTGGNYVLSLIMCPVGIAAMFVAILLIALAIYIFLVILVFGIVIGMFSGG